MDAKREEEAAAQAGGEQEFRRQFAAARRGERAARGWLAERFEPELAAFLSPRAGAEVKRRVAPEDLLQQAFLTFFKRLETFDPGLSEAQLRAYLLQIAKWEIGTLLARPRAEVREASRAQSAGSSQGEDYQPAAPEPSRSPVTRADDFDKMRRLVARLRPEEAQVIEWCVFQGLELTAAAQRAGTSVDMVRKRLAAGRAELVRLGASWRERDGGQ